ncbi:MAG TPA: hypothetical protein VIP98_23270 [Microlunatus sp.]
MGRPVQHQVLQSSYHWQTPVAITTIGLVVCILVLARSNAHGWLGAAVVLVLLWCGFLAVVWGRTRAVMELDGPELTVRRFRHRHLIDGRQVVAVREYLTGSGPSYRVRLAGEATSYYVPTALMRKGHSSFFEWLLSYAPEAELDKRSRRTLDRLRTRGLIEWDAAEDPGTTVPQPRNASRVDDPRSEG